MIVIIINVLIQLYNVVVAIVYCCIAYAVQCMLTYFDHLRKQ